MDTYEIQKEVIKLIEEVDKICERNNLQYSLAYGSVLGAVRHNGFIPWDSDMDIITPISETDAFRCAMIKELPENMKIFIWDEESGYHPCFDRIAFKCHPHELVHVDVYSLCGLPKNSKKKSRFINTCYYTYHILSCKNKNIKYSRARNKWKIYLIKIALKIVPNSLIKKIYLSLKFKYNYAEANEVYAMTSIYRNRDFTDKDKLFDLIRVPFETLQLPIPRHYDEYLSSIYGDYMIPKKYE